ncbi:MAG: hypothetical protein AAF950_16810 [Pseudomonadota bacterium]
MALPPRYKLNSDGPLSAVVSAQGAALVGLSFVMDGRRRELVLDPDVPYYDRARDAAYIGAVCGRVCGRIANGRYMRADGTVVNLAANDGKNHLHGGGDRALNRLNWSIDQRQGQRQSPDRLKLTADSLAEAEGYPGHLKASITYELYNTALLVKLEAVCDAPCPINLTLHPYFNLSSGRQNSVAEHALQISATGKYSLDEDLVPTSKVVDVAGTAYDFIVQRRIGDTRLDTIFNLEKGDPAACLTSPEGDLNLTIETDRDTLVVYDGCGLPKPMLDAGSGICLEPQDAPLSTRSPNKIEHPANKPWTSWIRYNLSGTRA